MRRMGGLAPRLPWTHGTMLVATLAIAGIPPFAGFFSKDEILSGAFASGHLGVWLLGLIGAALTAFYMFRLYILTFRGSPRLTHEAEHHLHESPPSMIVPLVVLAALSLVGGLVGPPLIEGGHPFARWLAPVFAGEGQAAHELSPGAEWTLILVSVLVAVAGIAAAFRGCASAWPGCTGPSSTSTGWTSCTTRPSCVRSMPRPNRAGASGIPRSWMDS
jgi:NADH-quinone oxidoreductase subunit L